MPFNALCPTCSSTDNYKCNDDCIKIITSDIKYVGPNLSCLNVDNCDSLTVIIQKTDYAVCNINSELDTKVDKIPGKGLSANDFTDLLKSKLDGIEAGAEVNVNADWNATSGDALILNKPTTIAGYGITDAYTKSQLDNGQLDNRYYTETELNAGQLDNRYYTETEVNNLLSTKENTIAPGTIGQYWRGDKTWQTLNTGVVPESGNLYYTDTRARLALSAGAGIAYNNATGVITSTITQYTDTLAKGSISLTTTGSSGASTYNNITGVFNIPNYTLSGLGGVPTTRTITINGTTYDLSANRSWTVGDIRSDSSYANPSWITELAWSKITGVPTASTTTSGILTSTDYTTLINKVSSQWISNGNDIHYAAGKVLIGTSISGGSKLKIVGLPTSPVGLSIGDVWINGCTLEIVTGNDCTPPITTSTTTANPADCGRYGLFNEGEFGTTATFQYNEYPTNAIITVNVPFGSEGIYVQAFVSTGVTLISGTGTVSGPTPCI